MTAVFVGRAHELDVLDRLRAAAVGTHRRHLAVVVGEAGIGKTWLCDRVVAEVEREGWAVGFGRCWSHGGSPPLWPWPEILADLLGPDALSLEALGSSEPERFALFRAVARALHDLDRPLLVGLDDAHYAEPAALLLLRFLAGALERRPVVLLLARRPDAPADAQAAFVLGEFERDSTLLPLRPFDIREATEFLTQAADAGPIRPDLVDAVLRATGGVPVFLARAAAHGLAESGRTDVGQVMIAALARLSEHSRASLAAAAVLGPRCSVGEVAVLRDRSRIAVVEDLQRATGLVAIDTIEVSIAHELVRDAVLAQLDAATLLNLHACAARALAGTAPAARVARHALAAAPRSDADAELAVIAARRAADEARRGGDYEAAVDLLTAAAGIAAHRADPFAQAAVLVEAAEALLASGRLMAARSAFARAATAAEAAGEPVLLARAVLGLSGVWVHELRNAGEREAVLARQRTVLAALPLGESGLRVRIRVRLAAEAVYQGGDVTGVLDALAAAREVGDDRVLAEALSLTHHALLAPEYLAQRLELADELVVTAARAGDGVLALFGQLWRTVDLYALGDPAAERALAQLRERTDALAVATVGYLAACIDVMRLTRAGRLGDAEAAAEACLHRGFEVGDADATGYYGGQLAVIRWFQGRDAELADLVTSTAASATLATSEYAFAIMVAAVLARAGREEAAATLAGAIAGGVEQLPRSSTWTSAMAATVEAAHLLDDRDLAVRAAGLLEPFADLPVMPSLGVTCLGVAARSIGLAALTRGDLDEAVRRFEQAVAGNSRLRHRPATAVCRAELADTLVRRDRAGDRERAAGLWREAAEAAAAMEMPHRVRQWTALARRHSPVGDAALLVREAGGWTLRAHGVDQRLPDLVGIAHLAALLARPRPRRPGRRALRGSAGGRAGRARHRRPTRLPAPAWRARPGHRGSRGGRRPGPARTPARRAGRPARPGALGGRARRARAVVRHPARAGADRGAQVDRPGARRHRPMRRGARRRAASSDHHRLGLPLRPDRRDDAVAGAAPRLTGGGRRRPARVPDNALHHVRAQKAPALIALSSLRRVRIARSQARHRRAVERRHVADAADR